MRDAGDLWYIRLPDGRVVRAKTTRALQYHVQSGRVPWNSVVRREPTDEWVTLDWIPELAEFAKDRSRRQGADGKADAIAAETAGKDLPLRSLGVRGLIDELLNALESTFNQSKLLLGAWMGGALGLGMVASQLCTVFLEEAVSLPVIAGCWLLAAFVVLTVALALTRMTVLEIARLRPARVREVRAGLLPRALMLFAAHLLAVGAPLGLLLLSFWLRNRFEDSNAPALPDPVLVVLALCRLILEVSGCIIVTLSLLLAPILAVEKGGIFTTLRLWWSIVRVHLGRLLVYEALVVAIALIVTLPFLAPLALAGWQTAFESGLPALVRTSAILLLSGFALTPMLTYLAVANVHIYLNVQYEFFQSVRTKEAAPRKK